MERRFSVEAKKFFFSVRVDKADFRLEERRKDFVVYVFVGVQCSVWLVDTVEEVLKSPSKEDFVKSYRENEKVLIVRGGGKLSGRSFAEVVRATPSFAVASGELKTQPLGHLDLFPVADRFEWTNGGEIPRLAVDCSDSELENKLKRTEAVCFSGGSEKKATKKKGIFVIRPQKKILGYAWSKLCDRIKAEVGRVVGFGLDQLHSAGFRGVCLGRFKSKTKSLIYFFSPSLTFRFFKNCIGPLRFHAQKHHHNYILNETPNSQGPKPINPLKSISSLNLTGT
jgi:hypothetical protein